MMTPLDLLADAARGAVILGLALAAMPLLRRAPASTRRLVIAFALAAAAVLPIVSRATPGWRVLLPAPIAAVGSPFAEPIGEEGVAPSDAPAAAAPAAPRAAVNEAASHGASPRAPIPWRNALVAVWALGALVVLARLFAGLWQARGLVRRATPIARKSSGNAGANRAIDVSDDVHRTLGVSDDVHRTLDVPDDVHRTLDVPDDVNRAIDEAVREAGASAEVRMSDEVAAPAVTGVLAPVVLVPRTAVGWSAARWRAVLLHELAHVRQGDCLAQIAGQIACALRWFDPLVWIAARRLRAERELSADERVLQSGTRPTDYAAHLLAIAAGLAEPAASGPRSRWASARRPRAVPAGALGMAQPSELLARVEAIVRPGAGRARTSRGRALAIAAITAAILGLVACVSPGLHDDTTAPPAASQGAAPSPAAAAPGSLAEQVAAAMGAPADRVELTIRPEIQAIVDEEMKRLDAEQHPEMATAIVIDPSTGEVLAIADPAAAAGAVVTGSTMKPLLVAAALEENAIAPDDRFPCDQGARKYGDIALQDWSKFDELSVAEIVTVSSNIGASRIYDKLGGARLGAWLRRFHFGDASALPLRSGPIDPIPAAIEDASFNGAVLAIGAGGAAVASPLHVAAAYAAIANHGAYNKPVLARRVLGAGGQPTSVHAPENEKLLRPETASAVMSMLERAVNDEKATGKAARARVAGVRVAGKTGTADLELSPGKRAYYASFVGVVPAAAPRFVILVGALIPSEEATGGRVAAPVFARIAARALAQ